MFITTDQPEDITVLKVVELLEEAGRVIKKIYIHYCNNQDINIDIKSDKSPVTEADIASHEVISSQLKLWTPHIPLLSEEGVHDERGGWREFWLLDPLDGTKEFLEKRDEFTINLSRVADGKTIFSAIMAPMYNSIYITSAKGEVFKYLYNKKQWFIFLDKSCDAHQELLKVAVSQGKKKQKGSVRVSLYQSYFDEIAKNHTIEIVQCGSAYKFCLMLEGEIDIYPRFHPTYEWDTSAGQYLLEAIGGGLYSLNKEAFTYNQRTELLNHEFIAFRNSKVREIAFSALDTLQR